jgi:hypothetical protein
VIKVTQFLPATGTFQTMRWVGVLVAVVLLGLVWSSAGLAATEVPTVTNLNATPSTFCAKKSSGCSHPGTRLTFKISTNATVLCDILPRFKNTYGYFEFEKKFPKGTNSVRLNDSRLKPGGWRIRVQARNNVGAGPIAIKDVRVVKHH